MSKKHDPVNFPSHYNKGDIGCIDAIKSCQGDGFKYYLQGSAIKYVSVSYTHLTLPTKA